MYCTITKTSPHRPKLPGTVKCQDPAGSHHRRPATSSTTVEPGPTGAPTSHPRTPHLTSSATPRGGWRSSRQHFVQEDFRKIKCTSQYRIHESTSRGAATNDNITGDQDVSFSFDSHFLSRRLTLTSSVLIIFKLEFSHQPVVSPLIKLFLSKYLDILTLEFLKVGWCIFHYDLRVSGYCVCCLSSASW